MTIPQITTASLPNGLQNQPYSFQFTESGGIYPFTWSATITPNTGGQFSLDPVTGILSSPNSPTAETETVTVQVSDAMAPHNVAQASFTFTVNSAVVITTASLPTATATVPYSTTLAASGGVPPYTWAMSPTNADGLTLSTSGVLSGTPTTATTQTVTFTATDSTNVPSAPVSLTLTVQATGNQPLPPRAMWPGRVMTNSIQFAWYPPTDVTHSSNLDGTIADPNTYNVYQSVNGGPFNRIGNNVKPRPHFSIGLVYWFNDGGFNGGVAATSALTPSTTYAYRVRTVSPTGVESVDGPTFTATTRDANLGSAPPVPVADPNTWIVADALPAAATRTTWLCGDFTIADVPGNDPLGTGAGTRAPNTTITGCSFQHALNFSNPAGGDVIVLTSNAGPYGCPGVGYTLPTYTGANGWTYIISDQQPLYNLSGTLPAYEYNTNVYPTKWTLTGAPGIGATSATLTANWVQKSGIYPVTFSNKERRDVTFTKGSAAITWNNGRNPYGWMGTVGPGLASAATTTISVVYLPSITPADQAALATIQFGGPSTSGIGLTIPEGTQKVRFAGIWFKPRPLSSADIGKPGIDSTGTCLNFFGISFTGNGLTTGHADSIYFDRCMIGGNSAAFITSGPPNYTVVTGTEYGNCIHGIGGHLADHFLTHQCFFQGLQSTAGSTTQDAQAIFCTGGGPLCIQNCHLEAVGESFIAGGSFVPQLNIQHDLTYRYNYSTKPQWWQWAPQSRFINNPTSSSPITTVAGQVTYTAGVITSNDEWRVIVTINGVLQDASTYTTNGTAHTITFNVAPAAGLTLLIKGNVQYYFGDHVKNLFELKSILGAHLYGNVQQGNWTSLEGGQLGMSMNIGCKDQLSEGGVNANNYTTYPMGTCPWVQLLDVDIHDNLSLQVGCHSLLIGESASPSAVLQRIRYRNNTTFIQHDTPGGGNQMYAYIPTASSCDLWFENNTLILDPANSSIAAGGIATFDFTTPNSLWEHYTIINNVQDAPLMVTGDTNGTMNSLISSGKVKYLLWSNNLTINDPGTTLPQGGTDYYHVPYASVGFSNFVDNLHPPVVPNDWNIVTGPYAVGSTHGGPVGATLGNQTFPLLGAYLDAGTVNPGALANIGKVQACVISGFQGFSNLQTNVANAKAANPSMKVGSYVKINSQVPSSSGFAGQVTQMGALNWWARQTFPSGAIATEFGGTENAVNIIQSRTSTNAPFPGGPTTPMTVRQWMAQYYNHYYGPGIAPSLDAAFIDNFYLHPEAISAGVKQADWAETGSTQSDTNATTAQNFRNAYVDFVNQLRAINPQVMVWANTAEWTPGNDITGYSGVLNGGLFENGIGNDTGGGGGFNGWAFMMQCYAIQMNAMIKLNSVGGPYLIFEGAENQFPVTDYQTMRYGLCSVLLDNGYYYFYNGGASLPWFDEFNFNLGVPIAGPNNLTNSTYAQGGITAWNQGVWRRDFQNGIALVNPRTNGAKTVTLETTYWHLRGTQANPPNNAAAVTSVTLADRDGLILSRTPT